MGFSRESLCGIPAISYSRNSIEIPEPDDILFVGTGTYEWGARKRPYIHPLHSPNGKVLTRNAPDDHPWHHGLWFTIKFVNEENFYITISKASPFARHLPLINQALAKYKADGTIVTSPDGAALRDVLKEGTRTDPRAVLDIVRDRYRALGLEVGEPVADTARNGPDACADGSLKPMGKVVADFARQHPKVQAPEKTVTLPVSADNLQGWQASATGTA